jgi:hypothetical protein
LAAHLGLTHETPAAFPRLFRLPAFHRRLQLRAAEGLGPSQSLRAVVVSAGAADACAMTPRAKELFADWHSRQGIGIKSARPMHVFAQCCLLAKERCSIAREDVRRIILKAEDITKCEERALSSARLAKFGTVPRDEETWREQIAQVRAEMYARTATEAA